MALAETSKGTRAGIIGVPQNERGTRHINVGATERLISPGIGVPVVIFGMTRGLLKGLIPDALGTALLVRGTTGHSFLYQATGPAPPLLTTPSGCTSWLVGAELASALAPHPALPVTLAGILQAASVIL